MQSCLLWVEAVIAETSARSRTDRHGDLQRMMIQSVETASPVTYGLLVLEKHGTLPAPWSAAMHALIIEDESLIAMAIEETLRSCGFTSFDVAISAEEAVTSAAAHCPDLITADVELRPGCGITAVQSICSEQPIPVLFITGSPSEVRLRMPGHALVEKPFDADHIVKAIKLMDNRDA